MSLEVSECVICDLNLLMNEVARNYHDIDNVLDLDVSGHNLKATGFVEELFICNTTLCID